MNFRVGDVCVGRNLVVTSAYNGLQCEILAGPVVSRSRCMITHVQYPPEPLWHVKWVNGLRTWQAAKELRLVRPPSWDSWITDTSHVRDSKPCDVGVAA